MTMPIDPSDVAKSLAPWTPEGGLALTLQVTEGAKQLSTPTVPA